MSGFIMYLHRLTRQCQVYVSFNDQGCIPCFVGSLVLPVLRYAFLANLLNLI